MKNRETFNFYRSFFEAGKSMLDEDRLAFYDAILLLSFENKDTKLTGLTHILFTAVKPVVVNQNNNYLNGKKGGRPKKNNPPLVEKNNPPLVEKESYKEKEKEKDKDNTRYKQEIISYLNQVTGKNFRAIENKYLNARVSENYNIEDFKKVIDTKSNQWLNTDNEKYLRPDTLFSNKFDGYLNEVSKTQEVAENFGGQKW